MASATLPRSLLRLRAVAPSRISGQPANGNIGRRSLAVTPCNIHGAEATSPSVWLRGGVQLATLPVAVGSSTLTLLAPSSVDAIIDLYLSEGNDDRDPYWSRPWHSAVALAEELMERPELVRGKAVAEIGSGIGLAGIAAAMAGADRVVLLDREPMALQCALLSAAACGVAVGGAPDDLGEFCPGSDPPRGHAAARPGAGRIEAALLDWFDPRAAASLGHFDTVIACDVLYDDASVGPVAALLPQLLGSSGGDVMLADPPNRTRHNRERFVSAVRGSMGGVRMVEASRRTAALDGLEAPVQLLLFRQHSGGSHSTIGVE